MREKKQESKDKNQKEIKLSGLVKNIFFRNDYDGYTAFKIAVDKSKFNIQKNDIQVKSNKQQDYYEFTCIGYFDELNVDQFVNIAGYFFTHPIYGEQFKVTSVEKKIRPTEDNIKKYLASGIIKGIGSRMAERIVDLFSVDTFDVIEKDYNKLTKVKGITKKMAENINQVYTNLNQKKNTIVYLYGLNITPSYIEKIHKKYGDNTINLIKINPYRLVDDIVGIGFKKADSIAENVGVKKDSPFRVQSAIKFCLKQAAENGGHVYLPRNLLIDNVSELIDIDKDLILENIEEMQKNNAIKQVELGEQTIIYLSPYYYMEEFIAKEVLLLSKETENIKVDNKLIKTIDKYIKDFSNTNDISLEKNQIQAIKESVCNSIMIITGGPGTGKTTTLKAIIDILRRFRFCLELCAPTGRAAKRMSETTDYEAKTIHRLLGINAFDENNGNNDFQKSNSNEGGPIRADYIIVDEASMLDIYLMYNLLRAMPAKTRLILVGDVDQLPSVGPGSILKDLISSNQIKTVNLDKIFRQAAKSSIVVNAHKINRGENLDLYKPNSDFFIINRDNTQDIIQALLKLTLDEIPRRLMLRSIYDIQILCPMKRGEVGTVNLNKILQANLNPPDISKLEKIFNSDYVFRRGDKVMQMKNNYSLEWQIFNKNNICISNGVGVFNGDTGYILNINNTLKKLLVKFDDNKVVEYDFSQLDEIDLAYAVTVHKSQGSEYKAVIIPILGGPPMLMNRNLLYTAVTRAKNLAVLVGLPRTVYSMIRNNRQLDRFSALSYRIKNSVFSTDRKNLS